MVNAVRIREMSLADYENVIRLWSRMPGLSHTADDEKQNIEQFLGRNEGLSLVAEVGNEIIGTLLGGHDGRRGFLYHLAVDKCYWRQGIGRKLVNCCLAKLKQAGIAKCHVFVLTDNEAGMMFWERMGFNHRNDIITYSKTVR